MGYLDTLYSEKSHTEQLCQGHYFDFFSLSLQFSMETMNLKISQSVRFKNIKMIRMLMKCTFKKRMIFQSYKKQWPPLCVAT